MAEFETISSSSWSTLSTVNSVDFGLAAIIPANRKIYKPNAKSLFIESLVDQLCKLLEKDPVKRRKIYYGICTKLFEMNLLDETYQLEELASLRGHYQQAMINILQTSEPTLYKVPAYNFEWSRYNNEYEEIGFIAGGGFGKVYKAKHHLDQVMYAVKKIFIKFQNVSVLIMEANEVKTLAKLNHPNIVQYKAAWLEPIFCKPSSLPSVDVSKWTSSDSDGIVFQNSSSITSNNESISEVCTEDKNELAVCRYENNDVQKAGSQVSAILYVSMQLCDETLRGWLNKRNEAKEPVDLSLCINMMIQATSGVEYIHSCNIVHHDIKPSNIFLSNGLRTVQVGDFGLSCCLQGHSHSACPLEGGRFGTPLYAAPEQRKGQCNVKSDVYSLGVVFIEMVSVFATEMERVSVLTEARSGSLPSSVPNCLLPIIEKMISVDAEERPTSSEVVKMLRHVINKSREIETSSTSIARVLSVAENEETSCKDEVSGVALSTKDFEEMLKIKDNEIMELKLKLAEKEHELSALKQYFKN